MLSILNFLNERKISALESKKYSNCNFLLESYYHENRIKVSGVVRIVQVEAKNDCKIEIFHYRQHSAESDD